MMFEEFIRTMVQDAVRGVLRKVEVEPPCATALSVVEAAKQFGISQSSVYELFADGRLPTVLVGLRGLVLSSVIEEFLADHAEPNRSECRICGAQAIASRRAFTRSAGVADPAVPATCLPSATGGRCR